MQNSEKDEKKYCQIKQKRQNNYSKSFENVLEK